jgi:transposase
MSLSDLCREFGVSRPTGYRWINRYKEVGPEGLLDLSRKPHGCSHATSEVTENAILALRNKHPSWGGRKLKARLEVVQPKVAWPAASTFGNILSRAGLTNPKQKKRRTTPYSEPFSTVTAPNQLWCMDFKGYFSTGDGTRCDPFTITDAHSRYLIRCQTVLRMDLSQVAAICEAAMRSTACPPESGPTTAPRSQGMDCWVCRSCRSAGQNWASCTNAFSPAGRSKTAVMNACTARSRKIRRSHQLQRCGSNRRSSIASGRSSTTSGPTKESTMQCQQVSISAKRSCCQGPSPTSLTQEASRLGA